MATQYDTAPPPDDPGAYASLPGTSGVAFVQQNMTPMKSLLESSGEITGCHPARWIHEVINNDFTVCDVFDRARHLNPDFSQAWSHQHRLVINGNQSFKVASAQTLSSVCLDCHFHFLFKMNWEEQHTSSLCNATKSGWPLRDNAFPWHHLVWVSSATDEDIMNDRSEEYPLLAREGFVCSAPPCTFQVTLEISEPRMPHTWVQLLKDHDAIREELKQAKARDPDRYEGANDDWIYQGPLNLNTYLKNQLEATPETTRSISKRNKRFSVLFGERCAPIFRGLRFKETVTLTDDIDEGSFTPPAPEPATGPLGTTEVATYRSFIEDVRAEIQCLIHKAGLSAEKPSFCSSSLYADMGCVEVPNSSANAFNAVDRYKLLGILATQGREIVVNAYKRQWDLLPSRRKELVEALMSVAHDSRDELLSDYAITQSSVFDSQPTQQRTGDVEGDSMISQSLAFLALQPPNNYTAEAIINAFRKKLAEDPGEASTARNVLMWIAQSSDDDMYQAQLLMEADAKMSLDTAKAILGLSPTDDIGPGIIETTKEKLKQSKSNDATNVYLDALDAVAEHTASLSLKQAVMELRHSYAAYGTIALTESKPTSTIDYTIPVGLDNIGNTCYLNSLLQYLYTVEPVRDVVLNYSDVELGLLDENIQERRIGGNKMQMDRGEAIVAHAFAEELAKLFNHLHNSEKSATRPSQRLANAVLLSTHTLLNSAKQHAEQRPALPEPPVTDVAPQVETKEVNDEMDTRRSVSSAETLVDADELIDLTSAEDKTNEPEKLGSVITTDITVDSPVIPVSNVEPAQLSLDTGSNNITDDADATKPADTVMTEATEPETVDQQVLNALEHQKRSSGTDQQDVEEVMGSIINRLQAAIRPSAIDEKTGIQLEKIMETFFVTTVNYTKKFDDKEYQQEVSFDRSITAFPATDGACSLYDALGRNFDQQILEESKLSRYTAIKTLPPILHILIQRTQSTGSKNGNAVIIPETLYLDRYMDTPHDSPAFQRRVEDWVTADRMADVKSQMAQLDSNPSYLKYLEHYGQQAADTSDDSALHQDSDDAPVVVTKENWDFDGPVEDDFILISSQKEKEEAPVQPIKPVEGIQRTHAEIKAMMEQELKEHEQTLAKHSEGQTNVPYRLHAVICHRGHLMSGHYWVWIYDFEEEVWRWYNDEAVKENKNTGEVLQTLSTGGEPYFLCYVRDDDKDKYVSVPKRQQPVPPEPTEDAPLDTAEQAIDTEAVEPDDNTALTPATEVDADGDILVYKADGDVTTASKSVTEPA